jgi:hypothetical protein
MKKKMAYANIIGVFVKKNSIICVFEKKVVPLQAIYYKAG